MDLEELQRKRAEKEAKRLAVLAKFQNEPEPDVSWRETASDANRLKSTQIDSNALESTQIDSNGFREAQSGSNGVTEIGSNEFKRVQIDSNRPECTQIDSNGLSESTQIDSNKLNKKHSNRLKTTQIDSTKSTQIDSVIDSVIDSNAFKFESNDHPSLPSKIGRLEGVPLALFLELYKGCVKRGSTVTEMFNLTAIADTLGVSKYTVRTIIVRGAQSGYLRKVPGKRGKGGFTQLELSKDLMSEMQLKCTQIDSNRLSNRLTNGFNARADDDEFKNLPETKKPEDPKSSSSRDVIKPVGQSEYLWADSIEIPEELRSLLTRGHLRRIERAGLEEESVKQSMDNFILDIELGKLAKHHNLVGYFMQSMIGDKGVGFYGQPKDREYLRAKARAMAAKEYEALKEAVRNDLLNSEEFEKPKKQRGSLDDIPF